LSVLPGKRAAIADHLTLKKTRVVSVIFKLNYEYLDNNNIIIHRYTTPTSYQKEKKPRKIKIIKRYIKVLVSQNTVKLNYSLFFFK
jgi:hypothetical protein